MAKKVTRKEYLEWMALMPRIDVWGAYVAYDQKKCNQLLRQEYIEDIDTDSLMPPIDDAFLTGESTWHWKKDYQTDVPRLSFENNPDENGGRVAEANMTMAIIGGTEVDLYGNSNGQTEVTLISSRDPLDHPELKANRVLLKDIKGGVDSSGKVVLDLGALDVQRYIWELTGSRIDHVRRVGGAFMKRKFREAEPARRTYSLGELAYTNQEFMSPERFELRTVMEEGANVQSAANFGNGALELFIAMKGQPLGSTPGEDWKYPIPSDAAGIDTCMIFNNTLLMRNIIGKGTARAFNESDAKFKETVDNRGFITVLEADSTNVGYMKLPPMDLPVPGYQVRIDEYRVPTYTDPDRKLSMTLFPDNKLRVGMGGVDIQRRVNCNVDGSVYEVDMGVGLSATYSFKVDANMRKLIVELVDFQAYLNVNTPGAMPGVVKIFFTDGFNGVMKPVLVNAVNQIFNELDAVDVFVINSLLFNSEDSVNIKTVDVTGDLQLFGSISPRLTTFAIDPVEILLGYGDTHVFKTSPDTPVAWSVSNLDGSTAGAGRIDPDGKYTAPGIDEIKGTYTRVKIIATGGGRDGKSYISKALVTIAARAVTLNPLVQSCPASGTEQQTREFSANSSKGSLKWSVIGNGSIPEVANPDRTNVYIAPPKDMTLEEQSFTIEEVKVVTNTANPHTQSSYVVVTHDKQNLSVTAKYDDPAVGQARFAATFNNKPAPEVVWSCFPETGAGKIDPQGVYTADPASQHQFVIIKAWFKLSEFDLFLGDAFFIQPLPLGPMPSKPAPEKPQPGPDGMPEI
jgi:hypothetical protein